MNGVCECPAKLCDLCPYPSFATNITEALRGSGSVMIRGVLRVLGVVVLEWDIVWAGFQSEDVRNSELRGGN